VSGVSVWRCYVTDAVHQRPLRLQWNLTHNRHDQWEGPPGTEQLALFAPQAALSLTENDNDVIFPMKLAKKRGSCASGAECVKKEKVNKKVGRKGRGARRMEQSGEGGEGGRESKKKKEEGGRRERKGG